MQEVPIAAAADTWFKSSYSGASTTECVETAFRAEKIAVRDSKNPTRPVITFSGDAWLQFLRAVRGAGLW
ncbi:DUF397 domain-containing protein [Streptomyces inhibens]|uniref:DUF397 domain-containing protein n=1 Tax=Streptomyces inhibens TaxID=2293571 RepID=UPI001EE77D53|nr:DUF397 domain-containing protein [Streptomyces inhibens]UKY51136.1 DUF397 domain-containing protein [Streptomyces inhibens]